MLVFFLFFELKKMTFSKKTCEIIPIFPLGRIIYSDKKIRVRDYFISDIFVFLQ